MQGTQEKNLKRILLFYCGKMCDQPYNSWQKNKHYLVFMRSKKCLCIASWKIFFQTIVDATRTLYSEYLECSFDDVSIMMFQLSSFVLLISKKKMKTRLLQSRPHCKLLMDVVPTMQCFMGAYSIKMGLVASDIFRSCKKPLSLPSRYLQTHNLDRSIDLF